MTGGQCTCDAELLITSPMLQAALENARYGFPVYPAKPREKRPMYRGWQRAATTDPDRLVEAWSRKPKANIGILCGRGVVVLDADSNRGIDALDELELPPTTAVRTARGEHRYFTGKARSVPDLLSDVELRGDGSGVLGAGSVHPDGTAYEWIIPPWDVSPQPIPEPIRALLSASRPALEESLGPSPILRGTRNNTLTRIAGSLRGRHGLTDSALKAALLAINEEQCRPPLREDEVGEIAGSANRWAGPPPWLSDPDFFVDENLSPRAVLVLRVLADHAKGDGTCHPGIRRLAARTGFTKTTVERALGDLEQLGRISVTRSYAGNRYTLLLQGAAVQEGGTAW